MWSIITQAVVPLGCLAVLLLSLLGEKTRTHSAYLSGVLITQRVYLCEQQGALPVFPGTEFVTMLALAWKESLTPQTCAEVQALYVRARTMLPALTVLSPM